MWRCAGELANLFGAGSHWREPGVDWPRPPDWGKGFGEVAGSLTPLYGVLEWNLRGTHSVQTASRPLRITGRGSRLQFPSLLEGVGLWGARSPWRLTSPSPVPSDHNPRLPVEPAVFSLGEVSGGLGVDADGRSSSAGRPRSVVVFDCEDASWRVLNPIKLHPNRLKPVWPDPDWFNSVQQFDQQRSRRDVAGRSP